MLFDILNKRAHQLEHLHALESPVQLHALLRTIIVVTLVIQLFDHLVALLQESLVLLFERVFLNL